MQPDKSAIERAFELARSGRYASAHDVKTAIGREGYNTQQIQGGVLIGQLRRAIVKARDERSE